MKIKISYWVSERDNGIYDAMNKGIRHATGKIVGIINSDDWYEMDAFATVADLYLKKVIYIFIMVTFDIA